MSHATRHNQKLLNRVRRIRGQVEAAERAIEGDADCAEVMHLLAASRGAINSLLAEVVEEHVRGHLMGEGRKSEQAQNKAADELIDVVHAYFK